MPIQLSILADSEAAERAANVEDIVPTEKELHKLAKTKPVRRKKREKQNSFMPQWNRFRQR